LDFRGTTHYHFGRAVQIEDCLFLFATGKRVILFLEKKEREERVALFVWPLGFARAPPAPPTNSVCRVRRGGREKGGREKGWGAEGTREKRHCTRRLRLSTDERH